MQTQLYRTLYGSGLVSNILWTKYFANLVFEQAFCPVFYWHLSSIYVLCRLSWKTNYLVKSRQSKGCHQQTELADCQHRLCELANLSYHLLYVAPLNSQAWVTTLNKAWYMIAAFACCSDLELPAPCILWAILITVTLKLAPELAKISLLAWTSLFTCNLLNLSSVGFFVLSDVRGHVLAIVEPLELTCHQHLKPIIANHGQSRNSWY